MGCRLRWTRARPLPPGGHRRPTTTPRPPTLQSPRRWACRAEQPSEDGGRLVRQRGSHFGDLEDITTAGRWSFAKANANHFRPTHQNSPHWPKAFAYAKEMEAGRQFPPVQVYMDRSGAWLANDGAHRIFAARMADVPLLVKVKTAQLSSELSGEPPLL